jgi:hypothetical protein
VQLVEKVPVKLRKEPNVLGSFWAVILQGKGNSLINSHFAENRKQKGVIEAEMVEGNLRQ